TKPIFSFIVNRLAEKNLIDLQIPLHKYLPFDELELDYPEYRKMTAWHVLTHKSGMPNWGKHMVREPGTSYGYSGEAFEYLKRVLEKITGNNILTLIKEELIVPQYIRTMYFSDNAQLRKVFSNGHMDGTPSIRTIPREPQMAFSLHTEALAYTDFMLTLLERRGLKEKTYQQMMEIHSPFPDNRRETDHTKEGMGLGIMLSESELGKMFFHSGNSGDFKCLFRMYEDLGMGFVVFTNSNTGNFLADDLALFLVEGIKNKSEQSKTN
ncbi:MAG: serine hydrolase domain-containing protein, partial [Bacteroidota bacterium]